MKKRFISSTIVLLTGFLLVLDVILDKLGIEFKNTFGFNSSSNFVFYASQWASIGIFIFISMSKIKPYRISFFSPLYSFIISGYWLFFTNDFNTKNLFNPFILGLTVILLIAYPIIWNFFKTDCIKDEIKNEKLETLEKFLDLTVLYNSKKIK